MIEALTGLGGVILGWGLHELGGFISYKRDRKEKRLANYQNAFALVRQLQDSLPDATNFLAVQPRLDSLKQWQYSNSLFLDPQTNRALVGLANAITTNMLPEPRVSNVLLIQSVQDAFTEAERSIRKATGQAL